jgi:uncharacterized protein RhaS with RHS repeats
VLRKIKLAQARILNQKLKLLLLYLKIIKMKKILNIITLSLIFLLIGCGKTDKEYYDTGELMSEYQLNENGNYHGEYRLYYKNGYLHEVVNYIDGVLQGEAIRYDSLGNLLVKGKFLDGKKHGKVINYHPNGKISIFLTYEKDIKNGWTKIYSDNGKLTYEGLSRNDTTIYSRNYEKDSVFRSYKLTPLNVSITSGEIAHFTLKVNGPLEKNSRFIYTIYSYDEDEIIKRDSINLLSTITKIKLENLTKKASYILEGEIIINNKERYNEAASISVDGGSEKATIRVGY